MLKVPRLAISEHEKKYDDYSKYTCTCGRTLVKPPEGILLYCTHCHSRYEPQK